MNNPPKTELLPKPEKINIKIGSYIVESIEIENIIISDSYKLTSDKNILNK